MKHKNRENGSTSLTVVAAVTSLFLATMYVQNSSTQINQASKQIKLDEQSLSARTNNLSNLSIIRGMMNPSQVSAAVFEPALYPGNYFASSWDMKANSAKAGNRVEASGKSLKIKSFETSAQNVADAKKYFAGQNPKSQISDLTNVNSLEILKINPDPVNKYYISSIDVQAKNHLKTDGKGDVNTVGRIQLQPPEPGPVTLYIAPAGTSNWTQNYGTSASPLPPGRYKMQLRASGVVLYGEITRSNGGSMILGMNDQGISHKANNLRAHDEILGETIDVELGESKTETVTVNVDAGDDAALSAHTTHNADCSFSITPTGAATVPPTGSPTTTVGSTTSVLSTPSEISLGVKIYRVDGLESERSFEQKIYVASTITTTRVTQSVPGAASTSGGNFCGNRCPIDREAIFADYVNFLDRSYRDNADKTKVDVRRATESQLLPAPGGAICSNFELVAQDLVDGMGGVAPLDINKQSNPQRLWDIFDERVKYQMTSMKYERFYAYIMPSCGREMVGTRNGCGCFAENTRIRMADGTDRLAREIRQGDLLLNPKTMKAQAVRRVVAGPEVPLLYSLTIAGKKIEVTVDHPFLTERGLKAAHELLLGDIILDGESKSLVDAISREDREPGAAAPEVWNFELVGSEHEDDHYVLANGVMTGDLYLQIQLKKKSQKP